MLTLTAPAIEAIRSLTTKPGVPQKSGLRIVHLDIAGSLGLTIAPGPDTDDQVIEADGVRVFLQSGVAAMLGSRELSAELADDGVVFRIDERQA